jgi:hypothetical protein
MFSQFFGLRNGKLSDSGALRGLFPALQGFASFSIPASQKMGRPGRKDTLVSAFTKRPVRIAGQLLEPSDPNGATASWTRCFPTAVALALACAWVPALQARLHLI